MLVAASRGGVAFTLCLLLLTGCGGDKEPSNVSPRAEITITDDGEIFLPVDDCATPDPSVEIPEIQSAEQVREELGWSPLIAGDGYELHTYGWRSVVACDGSLAVMVFYKSQATGLTVLLTQGITADDFPNGTLSEPVSIGGHDVRFLEEDDSIAVLPMTEPAGRYATVAGGSRINVEAFIATLH